MNLLSQEYLPKTRLSTSGSEKGDVFKPGVKNVEVEVERLS